MPTVLILYAHTEETSFNYALLEAAKSKLTSQGHKVIVSDLYKMGFNPVMSKQDATGNDLYLWEIWEVGSTNAIICF